jgi:hypothetical protein
MTESQEHLPAGDEELWALVEAVVTGTATPAERDRLEARLRTEGPARAFYVAYLDLHAHLQWRTRGASAPPARPAPRPRAARPWPSRRVFAALAALAAGLLVAVLAFRHGSDEGESPNLPGAPADSVAVLINNQDTVWEADMALPTETGSALPPGRLKLKAGVVEVAFHGGGEVLLEGPADFDVRGADRGFLHRGKLTAKVSEGAPAFRVGMPGVEVTDLSGECGLLRDNSGCTEVHVFEGEVGADLTDPQGQPVPGKRLAEKIAARVDPARRTITPVPLNEKAFANLRPEIRITDAAVRGGQFAGRNFGTAGQLMVKNSIPDYCWETFLRFDLSGVKAKVTEARVRLVPVRVGQPFDNAAALVADQGWGETTITWDNRPAGGPPFARWTVRQNEPVEFDVTRPVQEALAGNKKLSLRLFAPEYGRGKYFAQYGSRRGDADARPQLLLKTVP